jgi:gliding motility-associated-like protein
VNLGPDLKLAPGTQHLMTSSIQNGPIIQYIWSPSTNLSCTNCPTPVATIQSNILYSLRVTNVDGCIGSDTVNITVTCEQSQVYIPNGFSPDGDGVNDLFVIRSAGMVKIKYFRVFNRWGVLVFERNIFFTNDFGNAWDGKIRGVLSPPDVFVYTAEIMCDNGTSFTFKGNITLIR